MFAIFFLSLCALIVYIAVALIRYRLQRRGTPQDDGDEEDEAALVEIAEFIRVAALLLHGDCVLGPRHRRSMH